MADPAKIVMYVENTFDKRNPNHEQLQAMQRAAADLGEAGFGTLILTFLHLAEDGTLYYNDTPLSETLSFLPSMVAAIKARGSVRRVLISIGPRASDYAHLERNLAQFKSALASAIATIGLDGIDFDLERDYERYDGLLADLAGWAVSRGLTVTAAPFENPGFWASVLRQASRGGSNPFAWWNLQIYDGADYGAWVRHLSGLVDNPQSFLVPGYRIETTAPSILAGTLHGLQLSYPSLSGSYVWQYEMNLGAGYMAAQYAAAISRGLGGTAAGRSFRTRQPSRGTQYPIPSE
jgi:hypothetical protein